MDVHLLGVVAVPALAGELKNEVHNVDWMCEIKEGIPKIAFVPKINGQVKKIVLSRMVDVNHVEERTLRILVWNVLYHYGRPHILTSLYSAE